MSQGDSIYDFVDKRDHAAWKSNLQAGGRTSNPAYGDRYHTTSTATATATVDDSLDRSFCCRMYRARNCRRLPPASTEHKVFLPFML